MRIRALQALTISDGGNLQSIPYGGNADVANDIAQSLITDGLAEEYTTTSPFGTLEVSDNGVFDCFNYSDVAVSVPQSGGGGGGVPTVTFTADSVNQAVQMNIVDVKTEKPIGGLQFDSAPSVIVPIVASTSDYLAILNATSIDSITGEYEPFEEGTYLIKGDIIVKMTNGPK